MTTKLNHLAVIVAAIVYYVFGAIWFTAFAGPWRAATGGAAMSTSPTTYVLSFVMGLILAYAIAVALSKSDSPSVRHGVAFAVFMSVAFWLTQLANGFLYEGRPFTLWLIDGFYVVIGSAIMAAIIAGWRKKA